MQNPLTKFREISLGFEKPRILPEKLETLTSSNNHEVECFLLKFYTHISYV